MRIFQKGGSMRITISEIRSLALSALKKYGYTDTESDTILEILMYAQLRGNNQGLVKLIGNGIPKSKDAGPLTVIKETKLSAVIDGSKNMGMIAMKLATEMAITKAKEHGFGIVGTNNTFSSTGAIGYYANAIAVQNFIGFAFAGSPPTVAPHGSYEALYGTNPLAIGVPADPEPIVLDMATAAMAYYGLIEAKTAGKSIPEGLAYDKEGKPTTDPSAAMDGAIKSFGGYKGSGLGFMVTAFTGPLLGAGFAGIGDRTDWGNLVMAIDPELLTDTTEFKKNITRMATRVKQTKPLPNVKEILLPGERGNKLTKARTASGEMDIETHLYNELKKAATH